MNAIDKYTEASKALNDAREWYSMLGKEYHGGGGGHGSITSVRFAATLYFQEYDGATNYHECPEALCKALGSVVQSKAGNLIAEAIAIMERTREDAAKEVHAELARLAKEAGL